jgi:ubiquitin-activating enzyme E1 C
MPLVNDAFSSLRPLLVREGKFTREGYIGDEGNIQALQENFSLLIVGAGGLGCELLKNIALSGFKDITLIDLDTIDVSNLNRQFLFRKGDEGKSKAEVAAARIQEAVPDCKVTYFCRKIQTFPKSWYLSFNVVIAGLDNQAAREWLNQTLCDLVCWKEDEKGNVGPDPDSIIPMIDGGTEGFQGQARIFFPTMSSCFTCQTGADQGGPELHMCTPAVTPRVPEHCAMYAHLFMWPRLCEFKSPRDYKMVAKDERNDTPVELDKDDGGHMTWLFNRAQEWAEQHNISGLSYSLTQQVVKNIIPAIASTNATIAAMCTNECLKFVSYGAPLLDNFIRYNGQAFGPGTYGHTFNFERDEDCKICHAPLVVRCTPTSTGQDVFDALAALGLRDVSMIRRTRESNPNDDVFSEHFAGNCLSSVEITSNAVVEVRAWQGSSEVLKRVLLFFGNAEEEEEE